MMKRTVLKTVCAILAACIPLCVPGALAGAEAPCDHYYYETVTPPTCTEDGYIVCVCEKCGDSYIRTADEYDRWTDWYEPMYETDIRYDTGKNVNRSNIAVFYRLVLADYIENRIDSGETAPEPDGQSPWRADIDTYPMRFGGVTVTFDEIRNGTISYELALVEADPEYGTYRYKIRFNDCDLHAKGHREAERYENVKRDKNGGVYYQEIVTYCSVCGEELGVRVDDAYYEELPTEPMSTAPQEEPVYGVTPHTTAFGSYAELLDFVELPTVPQNLPENFTETFERSLRLLKENGIGTLFYNDTPLPLADGQEPIRYAVWEGGFRLNLFVRTEDGTPITVGNDYRFSDTAPEEGSGIKYETLTDVGFALPAGISEPTVRETADAAAPEILIWGKYGEIGVTVRVNKSVFREKLFEGASVQNLFEFGERIAVMEQAPLGDVDLDLRVTSADAREILRCAARLSCSISNRKNADVNEDGRVSAADARLALRIAAKLDTTAPAA